MQGDNGANSAKRTSEGKREREDERERERERTRSAIQRGFLLGRRFAALFY